MTAAAEPSDEPTPTGAALARLRADPLLAAALAFWFVTIVAYFAPLPDALYTDFGVSAAEFGLLILVPLLFLSAAIKATPGAARQFWALVTAAFVFWLAGRASDVLTRDTGNFTPGLIAELVYLGYYGCIIIAVELRLEMRGDPLWFLNFGTSALAGVLLLLAIVSYVALVPFVAGTAEYQSYFYLYAAMDAYLAGRLTIAAIQSGQDSWSRAYWLLALTFALIAAADILSWLYRIDYLDFRSSNTVNLVWNLWCLAAFLASRVELGFRQTPTPLIERIYPAANILVIFSLAPPILHLAGYGFGQFDPALQDARILFVLFWIMLIGVILIGFHWLLRKKFLQLRSDRGFAELKAESLERQLERSLTMATLGRLSAGLAHDFGNTISAIGMHAKLIADRRNTGDVDPRDIEGVNRGVQYAQDLVDKLHVFGSARERQTAVPVDIVAEARDTLQLVGPSLKQHLSLTLEHVKPSAFALAVEADVHRVLTNFLYNANDAVGVSGEITVAVREEFVSGECASCASRFSGRYVTLSVSDNGHGVDPAIAKNLFEPLVTSKARGLGGGLGLSTVHAIVHRIGGHIGLKPLAGGGSCFSAYFVASGAE